VPNQPLAPLTSIVDQAVVVSWKSPYNGGSIITDYVVTIRHADGTTYSTIADCDGSSSAAVQTRQCTIAIESLQQTPFDLPWGSSIYAKVSAVNIMGESQSSQGGNGAVILRVPDIPVNLQNQAAFSNAYSISIQWSDGADSGGTPIIDYRVWYDQGTGEMTVLTFEITENSYTTSVPLTAGVSYTFKV